MDIKAFIAKNREKIYQQAMKNGIYDADGNPVLAKDDPWRADDVWDELFMEDKVSAFEYPRKATRTAKRLASVDSL